MPDWVADLGIALAAEATALITILATEGSAPRGVGTRMIVTAGTERGTIGGGRLELQAVEQARALLAQPPGSWRVQDYPLGPLLGQCCGGRVRLLVEHVDPADRDWLADAAPGRLLVSRFAADRIERSVTDKAAPARVAARGARPCPGDVVVDRLGEDRRPVQLFGAGHVGRAIAGALAPLPFDLAWFDPRADYAALPGVVHVAEDALADCAAAAAADAAVLVLTHDHALDYALTAAALRSGASFVGLIGSATKRARFLARLAADCIDASRLTCPIGLAGIPGKEPEVIAVATAAQLLAWRSRSRSPSLP